MGEGVNRDGAHDTGDGRNAGESDGEGVSQFKQGKGNALGKGQLGEEGGRALTMRDR